MFWPGGMSDGWLARGVFLPKQPRQLAPLPGNALVPNMFRLGVFRLRSQPEFQS
ncbi:MAG: hypothetical protein JWM11_7203 [Planctomycetaceae bacterium]|nr:hypothetical protein [Planctomycetaceae bacterium]